MEAGRVGCFIGLTTTDLIYRLERRLRPDEKMEAEEVWMGAGGPAANAAATFALLGGTAHLVTAVGDSPGRPRRSATSRRAVYASTIGRFRGRFPYPACCCRGRASAR